MRTKQEIIIQHFREGRSQREIAKEIGIHRKTVKRYIRLYEEAKRRMEGAEEVEESFVEALVSVPQYDSSKRQKRKLTQELTGQVDEYLKRNEEKRSGGLHKQVMKKVDIWEALCLEGYDIGYTTVCNYIRLRKAKGREAYIKQVYEPGIECEFDWAEVKLVISGKAYRLMLAVFTSAMSNYRWAQLFWRQDTTSFQQAHVDFFSHTQGVFQRMVYDNMRVAIRRFVGRHDREPTEAFLKLSKYYQFHWGVCNVGQAHEKGHVERSVEYVRRKAFCNRDEFESLGQANEYLDGLCGRLNRLPLQGKKQSAGELFEQERPRLYRCPPAFDCGELVRLRVDKYSTICSGTNHYSVPDHLVEQRVDVRLYPTHLLVYWQGREECRHERRRGQHGWYIRLEHYLDTLLRKPGALAGSMALKTADKRLRQLYKHHFKDQPKVFIQLLHYQRNKNLSLQSIEQAVQNCLKSCPQQPLSLDKIKILCSRAPLIRPVDRPAEGLIEQASKKQLATLANLFSDQNKSAS
jgi:transposase